MKVSCVWWTALCAVLLWTASAAGRMDAQSRPAAPAETRALWVLRSSLTSPASISTLVHTASQQGFNTLLVQVRGRGDAYFVSALEPRAGDLSHQPASFDPLATVLAEAHQAGLRVHAWVSVDLV